eukprot:972129-Amorphochlora_amoeboformis.AAC.1
MRQRRFRWTLRRTSRRIARCRRSSRQHQGTNRRRRRRGRPISQRANAGRAVRGAARSRMQAGRAWCRRATRGTIRGLHGRRVDSGADCGADSGPG